MVFVLAILRDRAQRNVARTRSYHSVKVNAPLGAGIFEWIPESFHTRNRVDYEHEHRPPPRTEF